MRQNLVETLHRGHHHEQEREQSYRTTLNEKYILLHARFVGLLEERRQIARLSYGKDTFRWSGNPSKHTGEHTECKRDSYYRREPVHVEGAEIIVESHQKALHKVDILGRNNNTEGIGAEHEDEHRHERSPEHSLRVVNRRIFDIAHMHARHFHTCIEEEYRSRKHNVVKIGQIGEKVAVKVHLRMSS